MSHILIIVWASWLGCMLILLGLVAWGLTQARTPDSPVQRLRHRRQQRFALGRRWKRCVR